MINTNSNFICPGGSTIINSQVSGSSGMINYEWQVPKEFIGNIKDKSIEANIPGNYSLVVSDDKTIAISGDEEIVQFNFNVVITPPGGSFCKDGDKLVLAANTEFIVEEYRWQVPSGHVGNTMNRQIDANVAGKYSVVIAAGGCFSQSDEVTVQLLELDMNLNKEDPSSFGADNGKIFVELADGVSPYNWTYSDSGNGSNFGQTNSSTFTISNLKAEDYQVMVRDQRNCIAASSITLSPPSCEMVLSFDLGDPRCAKTATGFITILIDNGQAPYAIEWEGPVSGEDSSLSNKYTIEDLPEGEYTIVVKDEAGCLRTQVVAIKDPPSLNVNIIGDFVFCFEDGGTVLNTSPSGFNTYLWSGGTTGSSVTVTSSGTYHVSVTDSKGCAATASAVVTRLAPLSINFNGSQSSLMESCAGSCDGKIAVNIIGGSEKGRIFSWVGPGGYTSNLQNITGLCPGKYVLVVTDDQGCSRSFTRTILAAQAIDLSLSRILPTCSDSNDGKITVTFMGGSGPYDVKWNGTAEGMTSNISTGHMIFGLSAGNYTVTVTDNNNCTAVKAVSITGKDPFTFEAAELSPACEGSNTGSIAVSAIKNGAAPYKITWELVGGGSSNATTPNINYTIDNLIAGTYNIIVEDDNGCVFKVLGVVVSEEAEINVGIIGDLILCFEDNSGSLSTNPAVFINYKWSTGATTPNISISDPGTYSVTVTDGGGCVGSTSIDVFRNSEIKLTTETTSSNLEVSCSGVCDGKVTPKITGGKAPYQYQWSGPDGFNSTDIVITDLCVGTYSLQVTDSNDCSETYSVIISNSTDLILKMDSSPVSCPGEKDGKASVTVEGGISPYSYLWSNGGIIPEISGLESDSYMVTVTDNNGCSQVGMVNVGEMTGVTGSINPQTAVICEGEEIKITATGGNSYLWSDGSVGSAIFVSPASTTTYSVTISNSGSACSDIKSSTIEVGQFGAASILISEFSGIANNDGIICSGSFVTLTATGGVSYLWEGGISNPLIMSPVVDGSYSVTITDANGCTKELVQDIKVNGSPAVNFDLGDLPYTIGVTEVIENASLANCGTLDNCQWTVDGEIVSSDCSDLNYAFDNAGESTIRLVAENSCGCVGEKERKVDVFSPDDCKLIFGVEGEGDAICAGDGIKLDLNFIPKSGCNFASSAVKVFKGGIEVASYTLVGDIITFTEAGNYTIEATYTDDCGCTSPVNRDVTVLSSPMVAFASEETINTCSGAFVEIGFTGYDSGERVTIEFNGQEFTYESSIIELFIPAPGSYLVTIVRVAVGNCLVPISGEEVRIEVLEDFEVVSFGFTCNDATGTYNLTLFTSGGDPLENIESSVPGSSVGDDAYVIFDLNPLQTYNITLSRGNFCASYQHVQNPVICNCSTNPGQLPDDLYYTGCTGDVFDISDIYTGIDDLNPIFDTVVYVLHDGEIAGILGTVYNIFPLTTNFITNDFEKYIPNKRYELSAVRTRKFEFFNRISEGISTFNFLGIEDCFAVSLGVPVIWHGSQVDVSGPSQVCENAYNEIFVSSGIGEGADLTINVVGLDDNNFSFVPSDGKLYVHFVSGIEQTVPIQIKSSTKHIDIIKGDTITHVCESEVEFLVTIDKAHEAPDTSTVILWPGAIFASTDTTENICHRWGRTNRISSTEVKDTFFENANERFYFADLNDIDALNDNRQIWVETYFCDDPTCFTRNIFNGQFPINLDQGVSPDDVNIYPNPTDGELRIKMKNGYIGMMNISIFDIQGRQLRQEAITKNGFVINKTLSLGDFANGIYVLKMDFEGGNSLVKKIVKQQ